LVFPGRRTVIFVHGCFWHSHEGCKNFRIPRTRTDWWTAKLARNKDRDKAVCAELEADGWRVLVVWECEVKSGDRIEALAEQMKR